MDNLTLLDKLSELGVTFCINVPNVWDSTEVVVSSSNKLLEFMNDPVSFYADFHNVTKEQYLSWVNDKYSVFCSATTCKGKPCKCTVPGGSNVSAKKWVSLQGEYCSIHSEGASNNG